MARPVSQRPRSRKALSRPVVVEQRVNPLERLVDDYLAHCNAGGLSPRTLDHYASVLKSTTLLPFCRERDIQDVTQLDQRLLDRMANGLLERGLSKHSVHSYLRAVNGFLAWCQREGELAESRRAQTPKLPRELVDVLSRQEVDALERGALNERDKLMVRLLGDTGLRLGELLGLERKDLVEQGRERYLRVHGKGGRDRLVPVEHRLYRRLRTYIERYRPAGSTDHVFLTLVRSRRSGDYEPLTKSGVDQLVRVLARQVLPGKRVYPHLFRHSYATNALRGGMNPLELQRILGHSTLEMISRVYANLTPGDLYEAQVRIARFLRNE